VRKLREVLQVSQQFEDTSALRVRQAATVQVPSLPLLGETEGKPQATRGPETLSFFVFKNMRFFFVINCQKARKKLLLLQAQIQSWKSSSWSSDLRAFTAPTWPHSNLASNGTLLSNTLTPLVS
jgi:hypothetical protein